MRGEIAERGERRGELVQADEEASEWEGARQLRRREEQGAGTSRVPPTPDTPGALVRKPLLSFHPCHRRQPCQNPAWRLDLPVVAATPPRRARARLSLTDHYHPSLLATGFYRAQARPALKFDNEGAFGPNQWETTNLSSPSAIAAIGRGLDPNALIFSRPPSLP